MRRDIGLKQYVVVFLVTAGWFVCAGCTRWQYAEQADKAALRTVEDGQAAVGGDPRPLAIRYSPYAPVSRDEGRVILAAGKTIALDGSNLQRLTLNDCLHIASRSSREFQTQKEAVYTTALALANSRRGWDFPLPAGEITGNASRSVENKGGEVHAGDAGISGSLTQRFMSGGALTLGLGVDLATDLLGWKSTSLGSLVSANFTQPLLRGACRGLAYEDQYRLERDFLLTLLEYERFTQEFAVGIVRQYYSVVQQLDTLENEKSNITRLEETFNLTKTLVEGGIRSQIELDQAEQNLMNARVRLMQDEQRYSNALDAFKIVLGLPIAARVELDYPNALEQLNRIGPLPVPVTRDEAFEVAMRTRPDVLRQAASVRDADRDVEIAADRFLPLLDVTLGVSAANAGPRDAAAIRFERHTRFASASFQYDLDQTDNRDAYRNAMLTRDRQRREWDRFVDSLRLDIRQSYRQLMFSQQTYELRLKNVEIAKRRRKLAVLQQKEGEASARDVLEAEDDLRTAQNNVTDALVTYTTTRLELMATLGLLAVDEEGLLHELRKPFEYDRVRQRYPHLGGPTVAAGVDAGGAD